MRSDLQTKHKLINKTDTHTHTQTHTHTKRVAEIKIQNKKKQNLIFS